MTLTTAEKGAIFQNLSQRLDIECRLYQDYITVVSEEKQSITKLSLEHMKALTNRREVLLIEMHDSQLKRIELVRALGENPQIRLSEVVKRHFSKDSAYLLLRKVEILRKLVKRSQGLSNELNLLVSFSQRLVTGCISIITSATNNVFRSYSPFGKIREAYHPSGGSGSTRRV